MGHERVIQRWRCASWRCYLSWWLCCAHARVYRYVSATVYVSRTTHFFHHSRLPSHCHYNSSPPQAARAGRADDLTAGAASDASDPTALAAAASSSSSSSVGAASTTRMEQRRMLDILRQLVDGEAAAARTQHSLDAAHLHLRQHPEALTSKIVSHFQQLFDVRSVDGIFPKMTEIYLTVNELGNFLKVLRSTLKLGACALNNEQCSDPHPRNQSFCRIVSTSLYSRIPPCSCRRIGARQYCLGRVPSRGRRGGGDGRHAPSHDDRGLVGRRSRWRRWRQKANGSRWRRRRQRRSRTAFGARIVARDRGDQGLL